MTPRVVINQAFADRFLPGRDPIGEMFAWGVAFVNFDNLLQVVGVVENAQYRNLSDPVRPVFYPPGTIAPQRNALSTSLSDSASLIPAIRAALAEVDPSIRVEITPLTELVRVALAPIASA